VRYLYEGGGRQGPLILKPMDFLRFLSGLRGLRCEVHVCCEAEAGTKRNGSIGEEERFPGLSRLSEDCIVR
jgi:hypothetical protein